MRRGLGARRRFLTIAIRCLAGLAALGAVGCGGDPEPGAPLPTGTEITLRNHRELAVDGETVIPRFLGDRQPGVCLQAPVGADLSQWRAALTFEELRNGRARPLDSGDPQEPEPPVARVGEVVCFERPWPESLEPPADLRLCGSIVDLYDGTRFELPCQLLRLEPDDGGRGALMDEAQRMVAERRQGFFGEFLDRLGTVVHRARAQGYPALATRVELIAVHYILQEGELETLPRAERLLREPPPWIDDPAATALAADTAYLAGVLRYQRRNELQQGWQELQKAEALYRRILGKKRLAAVRGQAEILARVGAIREALHHLEQGLASCADEGAGSTPQGAPCSDVQRSDARGLHAWLTLVDGDASTEELQAAAEDLERLQVQDSLELQERANHLVNLALLRARRGRDPSDALARAAELAALDESADTSVRRDLLAGWSRMAEAQYELSRSDGELQLAEQRCRELTRGTPSPRLDAWSHSCLGRIYLRQRRLPAAARAFEQALDLHDHVPALHLGRLLPLGPGERANDHYRAARVALELGDGSRAWEILTALDRAPQTDGAASGAAAGEVAEYRAFALEDEIFLLHRQPGSTAELARRTALPEGEVRGRTEAVQQALDRRQGDDDRWRELLTPLAGALWPILSDGDDEVGSVTLYALYGSLQRVPLAALPLPTGSAAANGDTDGATGARWLADVTVPALRPAGSPVPLSPSAPYEPSGDRDPLLVLDPLENLRARQELATFYGETFPEGRILVGSAATRAAFREHLTSASWLHVDTHGTYDPAFPESSRLELADGAIGLDELADLPAALSFANLSGCQTGRWPISADSGRYGIGGLLAQRGSGWVIASRADLLDSVARTFNPAFYRALDSGASVPGAYRAALDAIRADEPAVSWAPLLLLRGTASGAETRGGNPPS